MQYYGAIAAHAGAAPAPPLKSPCTSDTSCSSMSDFSSLTSSSARSSTSCAVTVYSPNTDIKPCIGTTITRRSSSSCETPIFRTFNITTPSIRPPTDQADLARHAIHSLRLQGVEINMASLKVLCKLGQGDSGSVYLTQLRGTSCLFALKVVDKEKLMKKNKLHRAHVEREVLELVNHPFLPALYAHFDTGKFSCLLMDYCSGGDLHAFIHHPSRELLSMKVIRFYAAQLVVAIEYLHMKGIIYRDLKPENVLIRENGHIMLSDFDLCAHFHESKQPTRIVHLPISCISSRSKRHLLQRYLGKKETQSYTRKTAKTRWVHPIWSRLKSSWWLPKSKSSKKPSTHITKNKFKMTYAEVVVEPLHLRTMSMVGTHEYLAPEVLGGLGHGCAIDWWMLGILIYELVYGITPFKGFNNKHTLHNIKMQRLRFPQQTEILDVGDACKSLLQGLLTKEPTQRLGSTRGALEIKQHSFFKGINWALIRTSKPPLLIPNLNLQKKNLIVQPFEYF